MKTTNIFILIREESIVNCTQMTLMRLIIADVNPRKSIKRVYLWRISLIRILLLLLKEFSFGQRIRIINFSHIPKNFL